MLTRRSAPDPFGSLTTRVVTVPGVAPSLCPVWLPEELGNILAVEQAVAITQSVRSSSEWAEYPEDWNDPKHILKQCVFLRTSNHDDVIGIDDRVRSFRASDSS